MHRTESWRWSLHYHFSLFPRFWTFFLNLMDGFDFNFRWRYSESKQSLEYDD